MLNQGTGGLVLAQIDAALNRLRGFSPLPYGAGSGLLTIPGLTARVDLGTLFLILDWTPPSGSPADLPLVLRYKSASHWTSEFGKGWSMPYHRSAEENAAGATVYTPERPYHYERVGSGSDFAPTAPGTNTLSGTPATGWTETQKDGTSFHYDTTGYLRTIRNKAGTRWTLTWEGGTRVRSITGPFGRRTSFVFDGAGMIRRMQDPGGRICTFTVDGNSNLVRAVTPALCVTSFIYIAPQGSGGAKNRLVARVDPLGNRTSFTYTLPADLGEPAVFQSFRLPTGPITTLTSGFSPPRTTIIDPRGGRWTTTFDSRTRPVVTLDPIGIRTSYQWDSFSSYSLIRITDGRGVRTTFGYVEASTGAYQPSSVHTAAGMYQLTYGDGGKLRRVTDERGNVSTLVWDAQGNRTAVIDPYSVRTSYVYDTECRLIAITDGLGRRSTCAYDSQGRRVVEVDALGNRITYAYDINSQVKRIVDPKGSVWTSIYDSMNRIVASVDPLLNRTSYTYDLLGRMTAIRNPYGATVTRMYDSVGGLLAEVDQLGNRTSYTYDNRGNIERVQNSLGRIATTVYDAANRPQAWVDPLQNRTSYVYDAAGNVRRIVDPLGRIATTVYDRLGRETASVDALGNRHTCMYDAASNCVKTIDHLGRTETIIYNASGFPVAIIDPLLRRSTVTYDRSGRPVRYMDANDNCATIVYDRVGRECAYIDAQSHRTTIVMDKPGRVTCLVGPRGFRNSYTYDATGRLKSSIDPNRNRTTYQYDSAGHTVGRIDADGNRTTFGYNSAGMLATGVYQGGMRFTFAYDALGRTILAHDWNGRMSYAYDAGGRQKSVVEQNGYRITHAWNKAGEDLGLDAVVGRHTYVYDALGRMRRTINPQGSVASWSYDAVGRMAGVRMWNGVRTSLIYDNGDHIRSMLTVNNSGAVIARYTYTFDKVGNPVSAIESGGGRVTYVYDSLYQLVTERRSATGAYSVEYVYDASGNRTQVARDGSLTSNVYDGADQLIRSQSMLGRTSYVYDRRGNIVQSKNYSGLLVTYAWDMENRLARVLPSNSQRITYAYDSRGLRVASQTSDGNRRYLWDGSNLLAEMTAGGAVSAAYTVNPQGLGALVSQERGGVSSYYGFDIIGSTRYLTNSLGNVTDLYVYDAYGVQSALSGSTVNPFRYVGKIGYYTDDVSSRLYVRARHYEPLAARFMSRDPLDGMGYAYAGNNPLMYVDPSGLEQVCGPRVWLYTGSWCAEQNVWDAATEAAGEVVSCWLECEIKAHTCVAGKILTTIEVIAFVGSGTGVRYLKVPREALDPKVWVRPLQGSFRLAERMHLKALLRPLLGRAWARSKAMAAAKAAAVAAALAEAGLSAYCGYKCSK